jgi:nucleoporin NUP82
VAGEIRQLIISPNSNYLAILTTHTVHIAILPESSHLTAPDTGPMKLKTYTLGPTTHVTSQSAVASALWHPLGVNGTCLVTVTEEAVVRVWELSTADRWSFDRPTLAIDLKKLADGTSVDQDFGASVSGANKGFSPDSFEMEVASACFSSRGSGGWYQMTLWVAMREGDVYALCPLLPEKWSPPPTLVPTLSVSIVAKVAAMEDDPEIPPKSRILAQQQLAWMSDIDIQEPGLAEAAPGEPAAEVYTRPGKPGRIPKLQGPFEFDLAPEESEDELDSLISDIYVIGAKIDGDALMLGEEDELEMEDGDSGAGLSVGVVCLLTSSGRLSICLDLDGIEAQWLPKLKSKMSRFVEETDPPSLLTFQVLDTLRNAEVGENNWPTFSHDFNSRYSFFVTDISSVTFISLTPWVFRLENELNDSTAGTDFRVDLLAKGQNTTRERIYTHRSDEQLSPLAASSVTQDPDLGYFLLTATSRGPVSITFESPDFEYAALVRQESPGYESDSEKPLVLCEPRPVYQPASSFEEASALPLLLEKLRHSKYKRILKEEVRLSPATLTIMTDAHKVLSEETYRIGTAAAELFRRCERLQIELRSQIQKTNDVAHRVDAITGKDGGDESAVTRNAALEQRISAAKENQKKLVERIEGLKKRQARGTNRELSDRERAWVDEVAIVESKIAGRDEGPRTGRVKEPWKRYEEVVALKDELLEQVRKLAAEEGEEPLASPGVKVPSGIRKAKIAQIMALLDRESALVEGAKSRLERLSLG